MEEFKFKEKKNEVKLSVKKERADGTVDEKVLVFDCSPTNYRFIKRATEAGKALESAMKGGLKPADIDEALAAERMAFELVAPGQWDEYFTFLGEDLEDMIMLIRLMIMTIRDKGIAAKKAEIAPAVGDGEQV